MCHFSRGQVSTVLIALRVTYLPRHVRNDSLVSSVVNILLVLSASVRARKRMSIAKIFQMDMSSEMRKA